MNLKILLPTEVLLDLEVTKITAKANNETFCLSSNHTDFAIALVPSILSFEADCHSPMFVAINEGLLFKSGSEVLVATIQAVWGGDLKQLQQAVESKFLENSRVAV
ncbi:MAG: F0F1 ATP synthase subunit epsilon [Jaaginema sp. PMC 1079.18]|nr:F0F1 ATP synthase subunit epsilon [Jaaginema sp. PMC 1080.18]MEC4852227.1 F0F1 ATP synthase subunit epsilon [Jaaginema sp. PMC 1079.18]MEC4866971.1 F0F1 ATP synthase subunit epsilon [Jaaginema sp. PMC 1078.18]